MSIYRLLKLAILSVVFLSSTLLGTVVKQDWNDSVRVCIIWNDGTGTDGMPTSWQQSIGEIGDSTRSFVEDAISTIPAQNVKVYSGSSSEWPTISQSVSNLKTEFNGQLPHVIVYINAGYQWDQKKSPKSNLPFNLIAEAADSGIGIVAIGDDAAYDAKQIFPLTGYKGTGNIIEIHSSVTSGGLPWPFMEDGIEWRQSNGSGKYTPFKGYDTLRIVLDTMANKNLPDKGLLWSVNKDTLLFKEWQKDGRGQADADVWDVDTSKLDNFAYIGSQEAKWTHEGNKYLIPKKINKNLYKVISTLQDSLNRVVMLGYQPQYLVDKDASQQIIYNSLYWASKAHEMLKIETPTATPDQGSPNTVGEIELTINYPNDKTLYNIWYTTNGNDVDSTDPDCLKYTGKFFLPQTGSNVTLKAVGFATKPADWFDSDTLKVTYEHKGGPLLDSARLTPGNIDLQSSLRANDTLTVYFNSDMKDISSNEPFLSLDKNNNSYTFRLNKIEQNGSVAKFIVTDITGKAADYLPKDMEDSISISPAAALESTNGAIQDGSINQFVILRVDDLEIPKIATPEANPNSGNTQTVLNVQLSVDHPTDNKHYTLRYAINGDVDISSPEYTSDITLPVSNGNDIIIKAVAFTESPELWQNSDTMTVTYNYVGGPVIDSAFYHPGTIENHNTSDFAPDTLVIRFNKDTKDVTDVKPFFFHDKNNNVYQYHLSHLQTNGQWMRFEILDVDGKNSGYIPNDSEDSINIDISVDVSGTDNTTQDETDNKKALLIVKERQLPKIKTPEANPAAGNTQDVKSVDISVEFPGDEYYTLYYTTDGSDVNTSSSKLTGITIDLPDNGNNDIILKVAAISDSSHLWQNSDVLTITYKYIAGPVIDSATYAPGVMTNFATSEVAPDTLFVYFDQDMQSTNKTSPFISTDSDGNNYNFVLKDEIDSSDNMYIYIIEKANGKPEGYLPVSMRDSITIDPKAELRSAAAPYVYQDGSNNITVPLRVKETPSNIKITSMWYDINNKDSEGLDIVLNKFKSQNGSLILIDPQARLNESEWSKFEASLVIFDVLGNRLISLSSLESSSDAVQSTTVTVNGRTQFAILWNCKNKKGRRVGSGAYLAVINVTDNNGKKVMRKHMLKVPAKID